MKIAASAPGRCGIIGNPSDIYGGCVVSCSVPARSRCELVFGEGESLPEDPALWHAATKRFPVEPCKVNWQSDIPKSSGLAGSTALLAATLACLLQARGEMPKIDEVDGMTEFAELLRDVELNDAGVVCGYQDAYMIVFGGLQRMDFTGKHPLKGGPPGTLTPLQAPLPFLLITTGVERLSGSVHSPMRERWLNGETEVINAMERIAECARMGAKALENQNLEMLADLMNENHRIVADLGGSGETIDKLIKDCIDSGASAAKLAGAGQGGTVIALTADSTGLENVLRGKGYSRFLRPSVGPGLVLECAG